MRHPSEAEVAKWERETVSLTSELRRHMAVDGFCPICRWPDGNAFPDPCDVTVETRLALQELCGAK
ncbi:hypothetical protein Lfu02_22810 [Longispora fulva]|nr:hypothetical protein Lfu02_22810 [Longispora fulva]